jgi:multiple sugar transport system ATP-binding protein
VKARLSSSLPVAVGDTVGLEFRPEKLSLFRKSTGKAIRTALHDGAIRHREVAHG